MFARNKVCSAVLHTGKLVHLCFFSMCRRICLSILSDSMILTNINDWFVTVMPSVHLRYRSLSSFSDPLCVFSNAFRIFPAVPVPTQALLSKWLWSCSLVQCLFSLRLCCGGCSWNSLLHVNIPWQIITHTSDFTFNPCFMHGLRSSYLL